MHEGGAVGREGVACELCMCNTLYICEIKQRIWEDRNETYSGGIVLGRKTQFGRGSERSSDNEV